ncbi:multiple organellar RNA editing factor 7, mitochondrial-like isoform X1 [Tasmannia lanceolata]|uniref:multiple organellar RNA editing factor 7, mitochondrial-like isoform X1 n=1 Tax=Tasmannia lanceolata TaxID=3420 RepID=UPI0040644A7E
MRAFLRTIHQIPSSLTALSFTCRLSTPASQIPSSPNSHIPIRPSDVNATTLMNKEAIIRSGCDFKHWLIVLRAPETWFEKWMGYRWTGSRRKRCNLAKSYVKILARVLHSDEETARKHIYSISTTYYYSFGCFIPIGLSNKIGALDCVSGVLPDCFVSSGIKDYGGEGAIYRWKNM